MSEQPFRNIDDINQENSSNRNESLDNTSRLKPSSMAVGSGNKAMFSDERGTWWGNENPEKAPIFQGMDGVYKIRITPTTLNAGLKFEDQNGKTVIFLGIRDV